jgi:hypothetical protein
MSTRDLILAELYQTPRDEQNLELAFRKAPVLYFDAREPFLPLAAGYTIFKQDGPSPSFNRTIELRPDEKQPAALAIEYAIWWDWDIHHLYELEHAWVFLDRLGRPIRVEASWHGKFYDIPLTLEGGRAVLLSEPGKHAFAPDPAWFHQRVRERHRPETLAVGLQSHVLINSMFTGKIRRRAFDRVLTRSFLLKQAFTPAWNFSQRFTFQAGWLVPWSALRDWIPRRVNQVLERLEANLQPHDYRALRLVSARTEAAVRDGSNLLSLQAAARSGADAVIAPLSLHKNRLVLGDSRMDLEHCPGLDDALDFCLHEPIGAFLEVADPAVVDHLAWFVRSKELNEYVVVVSADAQLLAHYDAFVPNSISAIQLEEPGQDPLMAATESGAQYINPRWEALPNARLFLTPDWIQRVHHAGLGIISWPVRSSAEFGDLQRLGLDVVWQKASYD